MYYLCLQNIQTMSIKITDQLQLAYDFVQYTGEHIFLTGKAGTGKTTFLKTLKEKSPKRMVIVAPTGVAAINAGGVTIHSFFQISFGPQLPSQNNLAEAKKFNREKINIIRSLDLLVIDEISMVRADLLDAIDGVLRKFRNKNKPFGGVQVLMIGDLQQLSPVVKDNEWSLLQMHYDTMYFFSSKALRQTTFVSIELTHVFRQQDHAFISLLNKVRENRLDQDTLETLNKRHNPSFNPSTEEGYITLCTHNIQAQKINESKLQELKGKAIGFKASIEGSFPEYAYPTDFELTLKEAAQVMFVKNDLSEDKQFYNGKIGKITRIENDKVFVHCPGESAEIAVIPLQWENIKYTLDTTTNEISERIEGKFVQYPLKLAWAITIHKSQGLTFERAIIDAEASFAHGQVYVALSRCKTLEGIVLKTKISSRSIINDTTINGFTQQIEEKQPDNHSLTSCKQAYQLDLLCDLFQLHRIRYLLQTLTTVAEENKATLPEHSINYFTKLQETFQRESFSISLKFQTQIKELSVLETDLENNQTLQERVKKAADYFSQKLQINIIESLSKADLDIDNKAVRKQIQETVQKVETETSIKIACMNSCKTGFMVKAYLTARANAVLEKEKTSKPRKNKEIQSAEIPHPQLYNILRAWRNAHADELGLPAYHIFSQKVLFELVYYLPTNSKALKEINGMGTKKVSQFGSEILELINEYCLEKGIKKNEIPLQKEDETTSLKPNTKIDSKKVTLDLFKSGKKIHEIAQERMLAISTIETHLAHFIGTGEVDISLFLTDDILSKICAYFETAESKSVKTAREVLGEQFNYTELRFALKHMDYLTDTLSST